MIGSSPSGRIAGEEVTGTGGFETEGMGEGDARDGGVGRGRLGGARTKSMAVSTRSRDRELLTASEAESTASVTSRKFSKSESSKIY